MKSPKFVHVWSKNIGLPLSSIGKLEGGTDETLNSESLVESVFRIFGYFSAKLFISHGSLTMSNKQGFSNGLHLLKGFASHVTLASIRDFLK